MLKCHKRKMWIVSFVLITLVLTGVCFAQSSGQQYILGNLTSETIDEPITVNQFLINVQGKGLSNKDALDVYLNAVKYHVNPYYLYDVYVTNPNWDKIKNAYEKRDTCLKTIAMSNNWDKNALDNNTLQVLKSFYQLPQELIEQLLAAQFKINDVVDIIFLMDLRSRENSSRFFATRDERYIKLSQENIEQIQKQLAIIRTSWPKITTETLEKEKLINLYTQDMDIESKITNETSDVNIFDPTAVYNVEKVSPFKMAMDNYSETVDLLTGNLIIKQTDFMLPGRNGLDFNFTRIYNSGLSNTEEPYITVGDQITYEIKKGQRYWVQRYGDNTDDNSHWVIMNYDFDYEAQLSTDGQAIGLCHQYGTIHYSDGKMEDVNEYHKDYKAEPKSEDIITKTKLNINSSGDTIDIYYGFGVGWMLDFPRMLIKDGRRYVCINGNVLELKLENEFKYYEAQDIQLFQDTSYTRGDYKSTYRLQRKDGITWFFDEWGKLLCIRNRYNDEIRFEYDLWGGPYERIGKAIDTIGRIIYFGKIGNTIQVKVYKNESEEQANNPLFKWEYNMKPGNDPSWNRHILYQVIPPKNDVPPITYNYSLSSCIYQPYFKGQDLGLARPFEMHYQNLISITHNTGRITHLNYIKKEKDADNTTPEEDSPSRLEYFVVANRYDNIPTKTLDGTEIIEINNNESYNYEWTTGFQNFVVTKTLTRNTNEAGATPITEKWVFNKKYDLIYHEQEGITVGENKVNNVKIRTDYLDYVNQLSLRKKITTFIDGVSQRTETIESAKTTSGNIVFENNLATGKTIERGYDQKFNKLLYEFVKQSNLNSGLLLKNTLNENKTLIETKEIGLATQSMGSIKQYSIPAHENISEWTFAPDGRVNFVELNVAWHRNMFAGLEYQIEYRKLGEPSWTIATKKSHASGVFADGGTDNVKVNLPTEDFYEIKIVKSYGETVALLSAIATGHDFAFNKSECTKTKYIYDDSNIGNLRYKYVYDFDGTTKVKSLFYDYDREYHFFPSCITTDLDGDAGTNYLSQRAEYNALGLITKLTTIQKTTTHINDGTDNVDSTEKSFEYDELNRLRKVIHMDGKYFEYSYDDNNRIVTITDEEFKQKRYTYDGLGRMILNEALNNGNWQTLSRIDYDSLGMLISFKDARGRITQNEYDSFGRLTKTIYPDNTYISKIYEDASSNLLSALTLPNTGLFKWIRWEKIINENSDPSYSGYDLDNNLIWTANNPISKELSTQVWNEYDYLGRITASYLKRDGNVWDKTTYNYNNYFNTASEIDLPGDTEQTHNYNINSLGLIKSQDNSSNSTIGLGYNYDGIGRLSEIEYFKSAIEKETLIINEYNRYGDLTKAGVVKEKVSDSQYLCDLVVDRSYNDRGMLISEKEKIGDSVYTTSLGRDAVGNIKKITYPNNITIELNYNDIHQLTFVKKTDGYIIAQFQYYPNGMLEKKIYGNSLATNYVYNQRDRATMISVPGKPLLDLLYDYYSNGAVKTITSNGSTFKFVYDKANQLKEAQYKTANGIKSVSYDYDSAHNRLTETNDDQITKYNYLPGNYLNNKNGSSQAYIWGKYGQLIQSQNRQYIYNNRRLLEEIKENNITLEKYEYDALGRRVKTIKGNETTISIYLGNDVIYEKTINNNTGELVEETNYIVANGMYIAKIVQNGSNQPQLYYCHTDPLGTIKALTDTNGEVVKTFEHEPFGKESMETGALEEESRFTGKSLDSTGLYYFNARYYNPTIGRFISADPASEGLNLYVYCNNNPLMFVDPDGRRIDDLNQWVSYDADGEVLSSETEIVGDIEYSKQFVEKTETLHITDQRGVKKLEVRKAKNAKYSKVGFEVAVGVMGNYYKLGEIIIISIGVPVQLLDEEHPVVTALKEAKDFNHNNITLVTQYYQWKNFNKESFECEISLSEPQYYLKSEYDGILYNLSISPSEYNKIVGFCK